VTRKANCQCFPSFETMSKTISGARIAPTFEPALKSPFASARSFFGNHSATVFTAAGKFPDSPKPNPKRTIANPVGNQYRRCKEKQSGFRREHQFFRFLHQVSRKNFHPAADQSTRNYHKQRS